MSKKQQVVKGIRQEDELHFVVDQSINQAVGVPSGKIITDSDEMTFVYLLECEEGYIPIHFPQTVWPQMVEVLQHQLHPYLVMQHEKIQLTSFTDELTMLIFNIEGNGNYGEAFSSAVEKAFQPILLSEQV